MKTTRIMLKLFSFLIVLVLLFTISASASNGLMISDDFTVENLSNNQEISFATGLCTSSY